MVGMFPLHDSFPIMYSVSHRFLRKELTDQEVHNALFEMAPLKAPGVDGFHAQFYQS